MYKNRLKALRNLRTKDKKETQPGEWSGSTTVDELVWNLSVDNEDTRLSSYSNYKNKWEDHLFRTFLDKYGQPDLVYYPCSDVHVSPSFTFNRVVYVDLDAKSMELLQQEWYYTVIADVTTLDSINGESPDLMIIFNPQVNNIETLTKPLKVGWFIICNNYHFTADRLWRNPNFVFVESLDGSGNGAFIPIRQEEFEGNNPFVPRSMGYCLFKKIK